MIQRASTVGELAAKVLSKGGQGEITKVFPRSVYIRCGRDFVVLLWGSLRSPLTINIAGERGSGFVPGKRCFLSRVGISADGIMVDTKKADVYRGSLRTAGPVSFPPSRRLMLSVASLRMLYDASSEGPRLPEDRAFRRFVDAVLVSLARGERGVVHDFERYVDLVGRGGGFTPAGDDFVGGFAAVYNMVARLRGWRRITLPMKLLMPHTVPESAAILSYAERGYVDEAMERLILKSTAGGGTFHRDLFAAAHRGHTSGLDMSLGVLLCEAAVKDADEGSDALRRCLDILWNP
jgi:hypothetical protein